MARSFSVFDQWYYGTSIPWICGKNNSSHDDNSTNSTQLVDYLGAQLFGESHPEHAPDHWATILVSKLFPQKFVVCRYHVSNNQLPSLQWQLVPPSHQDSFSSTWVLGATPLPRLGLITLLSTEQNNLGSQHEICLLNQVEHVRNTLELAGWPLNSWGLNRSVQMEQLLQTWINWLWSQTVLWAGDGLWSKIKICTAYQWPKHVGNMDSSIAMMLCKLQQHLKGGYPLVQMSLSHLQIELQPNFENLLHIKRTKEDFFFLTCHSASGKKRLIYPCHFRFGRRESVASEIIIQVKGDILSQYIWIKNVFIQSRVETHNMTLMPLRCPYWWEHDFFFNHYYS